MPFERPHHRRIARLLESLNGRLLREHRCLFGGGTVIALRYGEYRESVDVDFLVSEMAHYRGLRNALTGPRGLGAIMRADASPMQQVADIKADQYGIRTRVTIDEQPIKLEIIHEGRIALETPGIGDQVCGVACLTPFDMAASKLLANSDRWADDGVFSRDLIDLAMMHPPLSMLRSAMAKAQDAYGEAVSSVRSSE